MSEKSFHLFQWKALFRLPQVLDLRLPDPARQLDRIRMMERNIGLPVKAALFLVLFYYFFFSNWFDLVIRPSSSAEVYSPHEIILRDSRPIIRDRHHH